MVFIKTIEKMISFGCGMGAGIIFKKYEKEISSFIKKANKMIN